MTLQRHVMHASSRILLSTFSTWLRFAARAARLRTLLARAIGAAVTRRERAALSVWRAHAARRATKRGLMARAVISASRRVYRNVLLAWKGFIRARRAKAVQMVRAVNLAYRAACRKGFGGLVWYREHANRKRCRISRVVLHAYRATVGRALLGWRLTLIKARQAREAAGLAAVRISRRLVALAFAAWAAQAGLPGREGMLYHEQKGVVAGRADRFRSRCLCRAALHAWRLLLKEVQDERLYQSRASQRAGAHCDRRLLSAAMLCWHLALERRSAQQTKGRRAVAWAGRRRLRAGMAALVKAVESRGRAADLAGSWQAKRACHTVLRGWHVSGYEKPLA